MRSTRTTYAALTAAALSLIAGLACWRTGALAASPSSVTWSVGADLPFRAHEAGGIGADGRLFVFGGYDVEHISSANKWRPRARATVYDPATGSWTELAPLPPFASGAAPGATHIGTATDGTSAIYLAGGYPGTASGTGQQFGSKTVLRYDIAAGRYDPLPNLPAARGAGGLALLGDELHFVGGSDTARATVSDHWALDLGNLAAGWKPRAALPSPRNHLATAVVHGRLFVAGGQVGENAAATTSDRLEAYNPATDKWNVEPPLPTALSHLALATNGDVLYLLGGETAFTKPGTFAYTFNPATETWGPLTPLPAARSTGVAASLNGALYYAGGGRSDTLYRASAGGPPDPTPAATATQAPTGTPVPTATPAPGSTPTPTPKPGTTPKPNPTATPTATLAPTVTPASTATATQLPAATQRPLDDRAPTIGTAPASPVPAPGAGRVDAEIKPRITGNATRGFARFTTLIIDPATPGTSATIRCLGGTRVGCPSAKSGSRFALRKDGKLTLRGPLVGRALKAGATLVVQVSAPGQIARVERYRIGQRGRVTVTVRCLAPGATTATPCA